MTLLAETQDLAAAPAAPPALAFPTWSRETVRTYASGVELVAGLAASGPFALALHHQAVTTVEVRARSAKENSVRSLLDLPATTAALEAAVEHFGFTLDVQVRRVRSMIPAGRGLAAREADATAAVLALAAALEVPLSAAAASLLVHASTGDLVGLSASAYSSPALLAADTGAPLKLLASMPRLAMAVAFPDAKGLAPRDALVGSSEHDALLARALEVLGSNPSAADLGVLATESAQISARTDAHLHLEHLLEVAGRSRPGLPDAVGVAVGARSHNGAVLFDATMDGRRAATIASGELRELVGPGWFSASLTHAPLD